MLTGKTRYREHARALRPSLLVLQVEYRSTIPDGIGAFFDHVSWRDAEMQDISELHMRITRMNGHFEVDGNAYPIGPLNVGSGYKVTDMRRLQCLHSQPISKDTAFSIAKDVNAKIRSGELSLRDGDTSVADYVFGAVEAATAAG